MPFLFDLYKYICCTSMITCDKIPEFNTDFATFVYHPNAEYRYFTGHLHPLFGVAEDLYVKLTEVVRLAFRRRDVDKDRQLQETDPDFNVQVACIEEFLKLWQPPPVPSNHGSWLYNQAVAAADAIRWAALIRLWQAAHSNVAVPNTKLADAVHECLGAIACIRPGSPVETQMLFPLFMVGLSANQKTEVLMIEYRMSVLETTVGTGNIGSAHKALDIIWDRVREGAEDVDWEDVIETENLCVNLY